MRLKKGLVLIVLVVCSAVFAEDRVNVTGKSIKGDTEKKITFVEGKVRITQGQDTITAAKARIDLDNKLVFLEEEIVFDNPDFSAAAATLDYNLKKKNGTFKGEVVLKRKEKTENGKIVKDPFTLKADELYFETENKNFTAARGMIEHKDFTGSGERIEYNDREEQLLLLGNAYIKRPEGEEARGDCAKINLKEKNFTVENNVTVNFDVEEDSKKEAEAKTAK